MTSQETPVKVINYDAGGYDYRRFWQGRDYESWAETSVLQRLLRRAPSVRWLADLGGGFGRNAPLYRQHAAHTVVIDYSWTNLRNAEATLLPDGPATDLFLIRGNLYHLPFRDGAFDLGATVRVIHHLAAIEAALAEMGRTIGQHWILDVPIKHHLLARLRALTQKHGQDLHSWSPDAIGSDDYPFYRFHLGAIRHTLHEQGWLSQPVASVANFRRWDRAMPEAMRKLLRPLIYGAETIAQRAGCGWWGPAQFLWLSRRQPPSTAPAEPASDLPEPWSILAPQMQCPQCGGPLRWTPDVAACQECGRTYERQGTIWNFVVE
jgi:SAM-dependent methyltransferase